MFNPKTLELRRKKRKKKSGIESREVLRSGLLSTPPFENLCYATEFI